MHGFGYRDVLNIDTREFRVHTGCDPIKKRILCEVFEDGRFVYSFTKDYDIRPDNSDKLSEDYVKRITLELHESLRDEMRVLFTALAKLSKNEDALAYYRLGKLFLHRKFYSEAVLCFNNTIRLSPKFIRAYQKLTVSYLRMGEFRKAAAILTTILHDYPEFPDLLDLLGIVYTHMGAYEKAKNVLQRAIKLKPDYLESQFNLGVVLFLSTLSDEDENIVIPVRLMRMFHAIREKEGYQDELWQARFTELQEAINAGSKSQVVAVLLRFQIYFASNQDSVGRNLDMFLVKFMYGGREIDQDEIAQYEALIAAETEKNKGYADYWNEMGILHLIQCRNYFQGALQDFNKATKINPSYEDALENLHMLKNNSTGFLILLRAILK